MTCTCDQLDHGDAMARELDVWDGGGGGAIPRRKAILLLFLRL